MTLDELLDMTITLEGYFIGATPIPSLLGTGLCTNPCVVLLVYAAEAKARYFEAETSLKKVQIKKTWKIYSKLQDMHARYC